MGIALVCSGFAAGLFGLILLIKAYKFYKDNLASCC